MIFEILFSHRLFTYIVGVDGVGMYRSPPVINIFDFESLYFYIYIPVGGLPTDPLQLKWITVSLSANPPVCPSITADVSWPETAVADRASIAPGVADVWERDVTD